MRQNEHKLLKGSFSKFFFALPGFRCKLMLICPFKLYTTLYVCHCDSQVRGIEDQKKNQRFLYCSEQIIICYNKTTYPGDVF